MPFSSGSFSLVAGNPVVTATTITSSWANNTLSDIATGLSTCLLKDGTQNPTANLPMAGFKLTGLGAGSAAGDSVRWEQLASSLTAAQWAVAGGTVDAITAVYSPVNTTLPDGLLLGFRASGANATTTPTFAPDGLTAHTITRQGGVALDPGNIAGALAEYIVRYNLANTRWELLNPNPGTSTTASTFTFDGSGGTSGSITIAWQRIGQTVTLKLPITQATTGTGSLSLTSNTALPVSIRPIASQDFAIGNIQNNGTAIAPSGILRITTAGTLSIFRDIVPTAFTNSASAGTVTVTSITYSLP